MNRHIFKKIGLMMISFMAIITLAACSDDDTSIEPGNELGELGLMYELPTIEKFGRYYAVDLSPVDSLTETIEISSDAEWLEVTTSTLPEDGILEFRTSDNEGVKGRKAYLTLTSTETHRSQTIEIYQRGEGDYDTNSTGNVIDDFGVGWGYNAFEEYQSRKSICNQILDVSLMSSISSDSTFQSIQEVIRSNEEFEIVTAHSIQEMSSQLTKNMEKTSSFLGVKKTVNRMQKVCKNSLSENYMAYARLYKVVASKSVDYGAIDYLVSTISPEKLPFTQDFKELYLDIINAKNSARRDLIKKMLGTYGTHLIVEGLAGGSIDYVATFNSNYAYEFEKNAKSQCNKVFGRSTNSNDTTVTKTVTSNINNEYTFNIAGGSKEAINNLKKSITGLKKDDGLSNAMLQDWISSIYYSPANKQNLEIVDFVFMPIWDLFADINVRNDIITQVLDIASQSNYKYTEQELGLDNYMVDLTSTSFNFDSNGGGSLVKVLYHKVKSNNTEYMEPVMEICSEYVPKIRTDKRITVFYPIKNGRTSHSQGLFPGDGEGNRPAFLSFYEGSCYVNPVDGYGYYDKITKAYLMHGNLYEQNYQVICTALTNTKVVDQQLQFVASNYKYDIVKIGSGYWTRTNIKETMFFGSREGRSFKVRENVYTDSNKVPMLYAYILNQDANFMYAQSKIYGQTRDGETDLALYWYLPTFKDKEYLTQYIGNNTKPLFKNGVTGFDAQFCGYFKTGSSQPTDADNCYIAFKENATSTTKGYTLILTPNYDWSTQEESAINKMFPVRLYRSRYFTYPNL
jgi:hypothetical protein